MFRRTGELDLDLRWDGLQMGRVNAAITHAQAADPDPLTGFQGRQGAGLAAPAQGLTQNPDFTARGVHPFYRSDHQMLQGNLLGLQFIALAFRLHHHHLTERQYACFDGLPVVIDRRTLVVVHLYAIDADAGKTGNHPHDTGAAYASVVDAGAANARLECYIAGAPDARAQGGVTGAANARRCCLRVDRRVAVATHVGALCVQRSHES